MAGPEVLRTIPVSDLADLLADLLKQGRKARFYVWGSSMLPSLRGGDLVELEPASSEELRVGDVVAVKTPGGDLVVHRLAGKTRRGKVWWLVLWSESGEGLQGPMPDSCLIGRVSSAERDGEAVGFSRPVPARIRFRAGGHLFSRRCLGDRTYLLRPLRVPASLLTLPWRAARRGLQWAASGTVVGRTLRGSDERFHEELAVCHMPAGPGPRVGWQWIAVYRGRAIGGVTLSRALGDALGRPSWWLLAGWVLPWHRRRGVYRRLIREALGLARQEGITAVFGAARRDNPASWTALEKEGFVPEDDAELLAKVERHYEEATSWPPGSTLVLRADLASSASRPN